MNVPTGHMSPPAGQMSAPAGVTNAPAAQVTGSRPILMRVLVRSWEYRHPCVWARVRLVCGVFNAALGVLLLSAGQALGPFAWLGLVPLAGAALIFWTVYQLQHSVQA